MVEAILAHQGNRSCIYVYIRIYIYNIQLYKYKNMQVLASRQYREAPRSNFEKNVPSGSAGSTFRASSPPRDQDLLYYLTTPSLNVRNQLSHFVPINISVRLLFARDSFLDVLFQPGFLFSPNFRKLICMAPDYFFFSFTFFLDDCFRVGEFVFLEFSRRRFSVSKPY